MEIITTEIRSIFGPLMVAIGAIMLFTLVYVNRAKGPNSKKAKPKDSAPHPPRMTGKGITCEKCQSLLYGTYYQFACKPDWHHDWGNASCGTRCFCKSCLPKFWYIPRYCTICAKPTPPVESSHSASTPDMAQQAWEKAWNEVPAGAMDRAQRAIELIKQAARGQVTYNSGNLCSGGSYSDNASSLGSSTPPITGGAQCTVRFRATNNTPLVLNANRDQKHRALDIRDNMDMAGVHHGKDRNTVNLIIHGHNQPIDRNTGTPNPYFDPKMKTDPRAEKALQRIEKKR